PPRQKDRLRQSGEEGDILGASISHRKAERMPARSPDEAAVQRLHEFLVEGVRVGMQLLHRLAHFKWRRAGRHRLSEADGDRIRDLAWQLPQEASFLEAEDRAPNTVEVHR